MIHSAHSARRLALAALAAISLLPAAGCCGSAKPPRSDRRDEVGEGGTPRRARPIPNVSRPTLFEVQRAPPVPPEMQVQVAWVWVQDPQLLAGQVLFQPGQWPLPEPVNYLEVGNSPPGGVMCDIPHPPGAWVVAPFHGPDAMPEGVGEPCH